MDLLEAPVLQCQ